MPRRRGQSGQHEARRVEGDRGTIRLDAIRLDAIHLRPRGDDGKVFNPCPARPTSTP
ncbi:MAG: hypothetical protein AAFS10_07205 [Myxococcota bacterium]